MKSYRDILSQGVEISMFVCIGMCLLSGCDIGEPKALSNPPKSQKLEPADYSAISTSGDSDKLVSFKGVTFRYDSNVIEVVEMQDVSEHIPKDGPTYLPDAFETRHLNFKLKGASVREVSEGDYSAEINIYSVEQYKLAARPTGEYAEELPKKFQNLQNVLFGNRGISGGAYPFIPWIGATQAIHAHRQLILFNNGNGIGYLTQFTMDVDLINNEKLLYVFQGMTSDKKYFISATVPVRASYLPNDRFAETYRNYTRPDNFYAAERREQNLQEYDQYLLDVQSELENTNDDDFKPSLTVIRKLLTSLEVQPTVFGSKK